MKIYILPRLKDFSVAGYLRGTGAAFNGEGFVGEPLVWKDIQQFSTKISIILTNIYQSDKNVFIAQTVQISGAALLQISLFFETPGPNNSRGD